jgi:glycosyltransferase involved in cell wall biosynthesis
VHLLTFETMPLSREAQARWSVELRSNGIAWASRRYHKRPSMAGTLYDVVAGAVHIARYVRQQAIDVIHARAHVPLAMSLLARSATRARIVFDLRGLMAEEYVEGRVWRPDTPLVRFVKWVERRGLQVADQVVVLTERLRERLVAERRVSAERIEVIPCCTDLCLYPSVPEWVCPPTAPGSRLELVYAGSVTGLYQLDEMARFFVALRHEVPHSIFRILTNGSTDATSELLARGEVPPATVSVQSVSSRDVPSILAQSHVGISFRMSTASQIAASPTKIGEYLAAGLPVISNAGIGDMDRILNEDRVGVVVDEYSTAGFARAVKSLAGMLAEPGLRARCRASARSRFGLAEVGSVRYRRLYARLEAASSAQRERGRWG